MRLALILLLLSTQLFANYEGTLQFDAPINYKRFFCEKTAIPGDYLVKITKGSKSLKIKFKDIDGEKHTIKVKMPRHALPEHGGTINLLPAHTGQEFGLEATLTSRQTRREEQTRMETCTIRVRVRRCQTDETGRRRCYDRWEDRPGRQYVRYLVTTFQKDLLLNLLDQDEEQFGNAQTRDMVSRSEVIYRGSCQRNP